MRARILAALLTALAAPAGAGWHDHAPAPAGCTPSDTRLACAATATPAFGPDGTLILAWTAGGRVMAARSTDHGRTLSPPVALNAAPEVLDDNGQARPMVAADGRGGVSVAYGVKQQAPFSGTTFLARSTDGGRSFLAPRPIASDPASQRFAALAAAADGRLHLAWIDKRDMAAAKRAGQPYRGAALAVGVSEDGGATLAVERIAAPHSCECCRVAMALDRRGLPVVMWRHVFEPNIRDHAVMAFEAPGVPGPLVRVADDDWRIDACPHHGPALAVGADGALHAAWYTAGDRRQGLFLARAADGKAFSAPRPIGDAERAPSHPALLVHGGGVVLAWKEFDGEAAVIMAQASTDGGGSWSSPWQVASTRGNSDVPVLVADGATAYLSWLTQGEGWRLMPLPVGRRP